VPIILLLESFEPNRILFRDTLERKGYTLLTTNNSEEAILICRQHDGPIHLAIVEVLLSEDGNLPLHNGVKTAQAIRAIRAGMPILFLSGCPTLEDLLGQGILNPEAFEPGATFFLQKPFPPNTLVSKVQEILAVCTS
jgi:CheY-like chemotaxis protein